MGNIKPIHHEPNKIKELSNELLKSGLIGAFKGAIIGISTSLILKFLSPTFRTTRTQVKVFYNVTWISMSAVFCADKQLLNFEERLFKEENERREKILNEAADKGIFLEG